MPAPAPPKESSLESHEDSSYGTAESYSKDKLGSDKDIESLEQIEDPSRRHRGFKDLVISKVNSCTSWDGRCKLVLLLSGRKEKMENQLIFILTSENLQMEKELQVETYLALKLELLAQTQIRTEVFL